MAPRYRLSNDFLDDAESAPFSLLQEDGDQADCVNNDHERSKRKRPSFLRRDLRCRSNTNNGDGYKQGVNVLVWSSLTFCVLLSIISLLASMGASLDFIRQHRSFLRRIYRDGFFPVPKYVPTVQLGKPFTSDGKYRVEISDSSENLPFLPAGFYNAKYNIDKSKKYGYCAIGAGLSGTVFAERAANYLGKKTLVIDSRPHIGGNCYDFVDPMVGILRNQYGSHLFHTDMKHVWKYVTSRPKAPKWKRWYHAKYGLVNGDYVPIPVNIQTVNRLLDVDIKNEDEMNAWLKTVQIPCPETGCENAEQMAKSRVGEELYDLIFKGYTIKQWGMDPKMLNASVTARIPVLPTFDPRYFTDKWQALPSQGYTKWFEAVLDHPLIDVVLKTDFFEHQAHLEQVCDKIVYTGPIDRYFEAKGLEKLEYRNIIFTEERHYNHPGNILPTPVLNYPGMETNYTRAVEYKQYLHRPSNHTIVVKEVSSGSGDPYYPVPTKRNLELYETYKQMAAELEKTDKIQFVGRLANYKYFNMDQAIDNALSLFYKTSPVRADFMRNDFVAYKQAIDSKISSLAFGEDASYDADCHIPLYRGEFGKELRSIVPWAYQTYLDCQSKGQQIVTEGLTGSKYMYYFNRNHKFHRGMKRVAGSPLPFGNPMGEDVHMSDFSPAAGTKWLPPPYATFFRDLENQENPFERLWKVENRGKPLVVILNKYTTEWGGPPVNYFSMDMVQKMLEYLTPNYTVLYKRQSSPLAFDDGHGYDAGLLSEKDMIREEYPDVLLFEDFSEAFVLNLEYDEDPDDDEYENNVNLLLFAFLAQSRHVLSVQGGGTAVVGSYFGGTNIVLIKKGKELQYGDYGYFHKFSNATVVQCNSDSSFLAQMKDRM